MGFKEDCYTGFVELFQAVSGSVGEAAVQSCLSHFISLQSRTVGGVTYSGANFYLLPGCLHNPTNFWTYIEFLENRDNQNVPENIIMLKMYCYVQCVEVRYIYKVIGNLLGELGGGHVTGELYDNFNSAHQCFNDIKQRHERVAASLNRRFQIIDDWEQFLDFDLRNAIGHSDFRIFTEPFTVPGVVFMPMYLLQGMITQQSHSKTGYSFSEIESLYSRAKDFNEAFKQVVSEYGVNLGPRF